MTSPARLNRDQVGTGLVIKVEGPVALDGTDSLDPAACEPRFWTVDSNQILSAPPEVAIGSQEQWHPMVAAGQHSYQLLLSGPDASGGVSVAAGVHRTWVRVRHGEVQLIRPAGRLRVRVAREPRGAS